MSVDDEKTTESVCEFQVGGMWEFEEWDVALNKKCGGYSCVKMCKHCHSEEQVDGQTWWICPAVVVAQNEGGFGSTGVCLQCILNAAEVLGVERSERPYIQQN